MTEKKTPKEQWHEFDDGDLPDKPSDKCHICGKTAKELGLLNVDNKNVLGAKKDE